MLSGEIRFLPMTILCFMYYFVHETEFSNIFFGGESLV